MFLKVTEISGDEFNAVSICGTILKIMESKGLSIDSMCCITTDGASVSLMKQLLSIHCIAHRLTLASGQAADKVKYLHKYQSMINNIFKYYHYPPKHQSKLKKIQSVFEIAERKFNQTFHTRRLSFDGAVELIIHNYDTLITRLPEWF